MRNKAFEVNEKMIEETWQNDILEIKNQYDVDLPKSICEHLGLKENGGVYFILKDNGVVEIRKDKSE